MQPPTHTHRWLRNWKIVTALSCTLLLAIALFAAWYFSERFAPPIVVRVLFAETASCSQHERLLVVGVMYNRIGNKAFGGLPTLEAVVRQKNAFSCIGDPHNKLWDLSRHPGFLAAGLREAWNHCEKALASPPAGALGPSGRPLVYYHDKSIGKPASWDNSAWRAVKEVETPHFIFYSIVPARK